MDPSSIQVFDLKRIFFGDYPWTFSLEIVFRTVFLYIFTFALVRWSSRRAIGQISLVEFLLVIALGSAVGDPMFYADVPLVHGMVVITAVVMVNRWFNHATRRSTLFERILQGAPITLVDDGLIRYTSLERYELSHNEVFEELRLQGIEHLGAVRHAYLERNGQLSLFRFAPDAEKAGLRIDPPWELVKITPRHAGDRVAGPVHLACTYCGNTQVLAGEVPPCGQCRGKTWTDYVIVPPHTGPFAGEATTATQTPRPGDTGAPVALGQRRARPVAR